MAGLEETLGLDVSPALDALDQLAASATDSLGSALSGVVSDFSSQLQEAIGELSTVAAAVPDVVIPVTADTTIADEQLAGTVATAEANPAIVTVEADTAPAEAQVASTVAAIDAESVEITVTVDDGGAASSLAGINQELEATAVAAPQAASGLSNTSSAATIVGGAATIARGQLTGLTEVASGFGKALPTAGVVAFAAGVGGIVAQGIEATSVAQRFTAIVGDMADEVARVNVGTLDADLDELAISLGTDDEALRSVSATLFQFGISTGHSRQEAALYTNQIDALAARAVALDPSLGSVDQAAQGISRALASGRQNALIPYQISLDQTEVASRAMAIAQDQGREAVTAADRSFAGAQLAAEKYGATLAGDIAKGTENVTLQQRALRQELDNVLEAAGQPLVVPALDVVREGTPIVAVFAETLGGVAQVTLPAVAAGLRIIEPVLQPVIIGFIAVEVASKAVAAGQALMTGSLVAGSAGFAANTSAAIANAAATNVAAASAGQLAVVAAAGAAAFLITTEVLEFGDRRGLIPFIGHGKDMEKLLGDIQSRATDLARSTDSQLVPSFERLVSAAQKADTLGASPLVVRLRAFKEVADTDVDAAFRLRDAIARSGENMAGYDRILNKAIQTQVELAAAERLAAQQIDQSNVKMGVQAQLARTASDALRVYNLGIGSAGQALKDLSAAQQDENDRLALFRSQLERLVSPQINYIESNQRFGESVRDVALAYAEQADETTTATELEIDQRAAVIDSVKALLSSTEALHAKEIAEGRLATAQDIAAASLQEGTEALAQQLVASGLSRKAADDFLVSLGLFPGKSAEAASALIGGLGKNLSDQLVPTMVAAGAEIGGAIAAGIKEGLLPKGQRALNPSEVAAIVNAYKQPIMDEAGIQSPSTVFAREVGLPMAQGIAVGFSQGAGLLAGAASGVVSSGVSAARGAIATPDFGGISTPSTLFGLPSQGSTTTLLIDRIEVDVHDVKDPVTAQRVGESFADGFLLAIEKQNIRVAVRNG